ncbi:hypothetical protein [Streptomyces massasporeus]|uniref:hypothetical protein n=1 Tax=Streptomyces massasporeus TaxID=67324 RepID=UPI001676C5B3|nr:hypothetical protein [Streptomyces massasporeus]GGV87461.1 hypothetical protein GCM10010228_69740 [Streptomyces massasporeus]
MLAEAARLLDDVVMVGHSTGGMFMLPCPELEGQLAGMALVSSAPQAGRRQTLARWAGARPVAGPAEAADACGQDPNDETLRLLILAAAEWNFTSEGLAARHTLLDGLPYCHDAVAWADAHFDAPYRARWKPHSGLPALIVSGAEAHVVDQHLWGRTGPRPGPRAAAHDRGRRPPPLGRKPPSGRRGVRRAERFTEPRQVTELRAGASGPTSR